MRNVLLSYSRQVIADVIFTYLFIHRLYINNLNKCSVLPIYIYAYRNKPGDNFNYNTFH